MTGRGPKKSTLIAMPGWDGKGSERMGQRAVCRDDLRAWHCRQCRRHYRVLMFVPIHRKNAQV